MTRWSVVGVCIAVLIGTVHGFLEACWVLAIGQYEARS